jgi:hypothetical protein
LLLLYRDAVKKAILRKRSTQKYHNQSCATPAGQRHCINKGFPIKVNRGYRSAGYSASDEILKGLANQGLLDVSQQANGLAVSMFWK